MFDIDAPPGERLPLQAYRSDFRDRQWTIDGQDSWKLERRQDFKEPGFGSWEAFSRGDWGGALRLIEDQREWLQEFSQKNARHGITLFRVRVVEEPLAPYLQWEMHLLRLREACGEKIRVVGPGEIAALEVAGPLPEILTLGRSTSYNILYTEEGILDGAVRFVDENITARCRELIRHLYAAGEDLGHYFNREVAHLPPPRPE